MRLKHSGNVGDIVYSMPCMYGLRDRHRTGETLEVLLHVGVKADYYAGAQHPAGNVRLTEGLARALIPLLESQGMKARVWDGTEPYDLDLDLFRRTSMRDDRGSLVRHYFYAFDGWYDPCLPWLTVQPDARYLGRVICGRTSRYRNPYINWKCLDQHRPVFVGIEAEYEDFKKTVPSAEWARTDDLLAMAQVIVAGRCYCGNQSVGFAIAEGLKVPRLLETCLFAPNIIPCGGLCPDAINQGGFEAGLRLVT